ncbi:tripartite tricarboxylate transporter TctB family protein [Candidatus Pelagibacter sp.]|nr:tripartite tricarboxylate transporter TctB family protein [Candidatus Pelagibacter sp.]
MLKINNLISLICILFISILLAYASFTGGSENSSEAYLFPKLITFVMIILSSFSLIFYFLNKSFSVAEVDIKKLSIYLISLILFIFFGEIVGFYFFAILLFFINSYYYSEDKNIKKIIQNMIVTFIFMLFIYFLFSIMLKVQVPRFFLF